MRNAQTAAAAAMIATLAWTAGCGGSSSSPSTPPPAAPGAPAAVDAAAGDGEVTVSWSAVADATSYTVYCSSTAGAARAAAARPGLTGTTAVIGGLVDAVPYYFTVSATGAGGEGPLSAEVSGTPTAFHQADLAGTWRFSLLAAGTSPGWRRGTISVDASGAVTFTSYADDAGATAAPAGFLPVLRIDAAGQVRDAVDPAGATFTGDLGVTSRSTIVASASTGGTHFLGLLTKHGAATFSTSGDLLGFGNAGGGARRFVCSQLASGGSNQEWQFSAAQIGQGASPALPQYTTNSGNTLLPWIAPVTAPARPTDKTLSVVVSADGIVTETRNATAGTPPGFIAGAAVMTDDKSVIHAVGTASDGRFVLRVCHAMNVVASDATTATQGDLAGRYAVRSLSVGASALAARGTVSIDVAGAASWGSYQDGAGGTAAPAAFTLAVGNLDPLLSGTTLTAAGYYGVLGGGADGSLHGKLAYRKDGFVFTRTEAAGAPGAYALTLGVR